MHACNLQTSLHLRWSSTLSMDSAIIFTSRFLNSSWSLAARASSVVHTGVKSRGCENKIPHLKRKKYICKWTTFDSSRTLWKNHQIIILQFCIPLHRQVAQIRLFLPFRQKWTAQPFFLFSNLLYHHQLKSRFLQALKYPFNEKSNR